MKPDATCIHIVNDNGSDFFTVDSTAARPLAVISQPVFFGQQETDAHSGRSWVIQTWGKWAPPQPATAEGGHTVDVPFSRDTLVVKRSQDEAFSQRDIDIATRGAWVLPQGFLRFWDIVDQQRP